MRLILPIVLLLFFSDYPLFAQTKTDDVLKEVRKQISQKDYKSAEKLIIQHYQKNNKNLEVTWIYAQLAHWNNRNTLSRKLFEKAISISPTTFQIQMDYARMLYESGYLNDAEIILNKIKDISEVQAEALLMKANIFYWHGEMKEALSTISVIKSLYPDEFITRELENYIKVATALNLSTSVEYQSDNQPLKYIFERVEISKFYSRFWHPNFRLSNYNFQPQQNTFEALIENEILPGEKGMSAIISAGIYKHFSDITDWIGSLSFRQKIFNKSILQFGYNRKPYLGTLKSTTYNLIQNNAYAEFDLENSGLFSIHAGYNHQFFADGNYISSLGSWIITKARPNKIFSAQFGYGFSYSNAKNNLFESKKTVDEILVDYSPDAVIAGIYNPYFTPKNLQIHAAIIVLNYKPNNKIDINVKGNVGIYATCENPYFFLKKNSLNEPLLDKGFSNTSFRPFEVQLNFSYRFSDKILADLKYINQETFFYTRNNIGLSFHFAL